MYLTAMKFVETGSNESRCVCGAGQTKEFRALLDVFPPCIYRIFRASHNANRWSLINQMFANPLPVDARVKNYR